MALETVTYVGDLVATNPTASDPKSQGDDHLRNIKSALLECFGGFAGAILVTGTDGGAVNAYTLTPTTSLTAYSAKTLYLLTPTITNTSAVTYNVSGLGVRSVKSVSGDALVANDFVAGNRYLGVDTGTEIRLLSITKNYADQLAFNTALPAQIADYLLTSNGTVASFTPSLKDGTIRFVNTSDTTKKLAFDVSGVTTATTRTVAIPDKSGTMAMTSDVALVLLATLTPTAAANVDFLSTFTSSYDNYLIIGDGILPAADDTLRMRLATGGAADTGSNYYEGAPYATTTITASSTSLSITATVTTAGTGANFEIHIKNANSATTNKGIDVGSTFQINATPGYANRFTKSTYPASNTISGVRFYWNGASNFTAVGKIRIYGYMN